PGSISNLPQSSMRPPRGAAQEKPGMPENTSNWYEATRVSAPSRARLNFDLDVDVCVVGAGLAGLTVAREVAERGWSVAVLESRRVAGAASGRNTGFVLPGFSEDVSDTIE